MSNQKKEGPSILDACICAATPCVSWCPWKYTAIKMAKDGNEKVHYYNTVGNTYHEIGGKDDN